MTRRLALALVMCSCTSPLDPNAPAWRRVAGPGPSPRWGAGAVYDAAGDRVLVFGGETADGATAEVWELALASESWTLLPSGAGPTERVNPGVVLDATRGRLVVVDGRRGAFEPFADAWALDLATLTWTELASGPPARERPHATSDGVHAWFAGGEAFARIFSDLWQLDLATDTWQELPSNGAGEGPGARTCGAFTASGNALVLVGGHDFIARDGAFRYDLDKQRWSKIATTGGTAAGAHWAYAFDGACDRLYLATGDHDDHYDTSLADVLDVTTGAFARVHASALPPPRDHASAVVDSTRRQLVLFGGGVNDGEGYFGDTWIYPLPACP